MYPIKAVGIDLAKLVFSIYGVDEHDKCKLRKTFKRNKLLAEIATLHLALLVRKPAQARITGQDNLLNSAMMSTMQSNPVFKATYEHLLVAGKPKKVAMIACDCDLKFNSQRRCFVGSAKGLKITIDATPSC